MRNCPHCGEPIQDEAVLCKHCHQEVQPPLWTDSMRRCPYCAEWIDLENENCKFCGQHVGAVDLTEPSEFLDSLLDDDLAGDPPEQADQSSGLQKQSPFIDDSGAFGASAGGQQSGPDSGRFDLSQDAPAGDRQAGIADSQPSDLERELAELEQGLSFLKEAGSASGEEASLDETEALAPGDRPAFLDELGADTGQRPSFLDDLDTESGQHTSAFVDMDAEAGERPSFLSDEESGFRDEFSASEQADDDAQQDQPSLAEQLERQHGDQPWWGSESGEAADYRSRAESQQDEDPVDRPSEELEPPQTAPGFERQGPDFSRSLRQSLIESDSEYDRVPEDEIESEPFESEWDDEPAYAAEPASSPGYETELRAEEDYADEPERPLSEQAGWGDEQGYPTPQQRTSYYESDWDAEEQAAPAHYQPAAEPLASASTTGEFEAQSSIWASEVEPEPQPHSNQPAVEVSRRAVPLAILQGLIVIGLIGGAAYGLFTLAGGPLGARLVEALATEVPTETPIPGPTATLRPASILPPATPLAPGPTGTGGSSTDGCLRWDLISLDDEGSELCAYGEIRRWFAASEVPFVAIFSEEGGTFVVVDRSTTHPVGPGDCIVARGTVEVMSRTRPDIDVNGTLELCPEQWTLEATATPTPTEDS